MCRSVAWILTAVTLGILAIGLGRVLRNEAGSAQRSVNANVTQQEGVAASPLALEAPLPGSPSSLDKPSYTLPSEPQALISAEEPPAPIPDSSTTIAALGHDAAEPPIGSAPNSPPSDGDSSGQSSFLISPSVEAVCKTTPDLCAREYELLSRMAEERRDHLWASAMEEKLGAWIQVEPNRYTIRALGCRQSVCALEVASILGRYPGPSFQDQKDNGIFDEAAAYGYERNEYGARVTVTLRIFERSSRDQVRR